MQPEQFLHAMSNSLPSRRKVYFVCKRAMDIVLASVLLIICAPLMLVIAVLVKLDSSGPILFRQIRVGRDGKPFTFYKFRSMYYNSDPEVHRRYVQAFIRNQTAEAKPADGSAPGIFKMTRDPRITRTGRFLRRTSLDELPQIFNVLKGDMSLVGPRPPLPYEVQEYQEWHRGRLSVIPGITGSWQVQGRSLVPFDDMVRMDLEYIAQQSLWLDIKILALTIPAVIFAKGAK